MSKFMKKLKNNISIILLVTAMFIGLSLLLYPTISNKWNKKHQSYAIAEYIEDVSKLDNEKYNEILENAVIYNNALPWKSEKFIMTDKDLKQYNSLLNINNSGIMGYVDIPIINCKAPIYHGTDNSVLQVGIGHLEWSSLPVGGQNSHCVLLGHRGLPGAKLFTDLDKIRIGDTFTLTVLDEVHIYQVDNISIVEPKEIDDLKIILDKDYCTLVTCTPYGINTHRLLVRGIRVENADLVRVSADAEQINIFVAIAAAIIPLAVISLLLIVVSDKRRAIYIQIRRDLK